MKFVLSGYPFVMAFQDVPRTTRLNSKSAAQLADFEVDCYFITLPMLVADPQRRTGFACVRNVLTLATVVRHFSLFVMEASKFRTGHKHAC